MAVDSHQGVARPPGPPPHRKRDIVRTARSIRRMVRDAFGFIGGRFAQYGDIYHVDEGGGSHLYVTCNPDLMHEVLVTRGSDFKKSGGANDRLARVLGQGLLTADGELWKKQRRLIQPAFHGKRIANYAKTMVNHAADIDWDDGETIDLSEEMMALTLRIVCKALFDHDIRSRTDEVGETMNALRTMVRLSLLPHWVPTPERIRGWRAIRRMDEIIYDLIEERRRDGLRGDLLSMLLQAGEMSDKQLRDEIVTLFLAGHETTSHALTWTWYLLSQHPEARAKLHTELDEALGGRPPNLDDLAALTYTDQVINESMRLYPPAFVVGRVAARDTRVGDWDVPQGTQVMCWIWHCHHDPRWFDEPEDFKPERFAPPGPKKEAFLPFGAGTRMCIGEGFARMELRLLLATLAQRYALDHDPSHEVALLPRVTLSPKHGMRMIVRRRAARA